MTSRLLLLTFCFTALALASCGEGGDEEPNSEALDTQIDAPVSGGEGGPRYAEPIPITTGDYWEGITNLDELSESFNEVDAGRGAPFKGEIAGIKVIPVAQAKPSDRPNSCDIAKFEEAVYFELTYLPPGTSATTPQFAGICPGGRTVWISQEFSTKHGSLYVAFRASDRVLIDDAPADRIHEISVGGVDTLAIDPAIPEGFGKSVLAQATPNGFLAIQSSNIPLSELISVMEGIRCGSC